MTAVPRRFALLGIAACAALVAAGCVNFNVTKQVVPEGASNGPFRVHVDCQPEVPVAAEPSDEDAVESESPDLTPPEGVSAQVFDDAVFNGPGSVLLEDFEEHSVCTITEPESAGALTVTFACTGVTPPSLATEVTCTNIPGGLQVVIGEIGVTPLDFVTIEILVINDFTPPADPIEAAPTFTG